MLAVQLGLVSILSYLALVASRQQQIKIRLANGKHRYEGRIQLLYDGKWKDVCDHKWDINGAKVACRMLGFPDAELFTTGDRWGRGSGSFWLDEVVCHGDETSLNLCARKDWGNVNCADNEAAGVVCREYDEERVIKPKPSNFSKNIIDLPIRLIGRVENLQIQQGTLQVQVNGQWGYACSSEWKQDNSKVACGMLGYPQALRTKMVSTLTTRDPLPYLMGNISCHGLESSLVQCRHAGWGPLNCPDGFPVSIACKRPTIVYEHPRLRLRGSHQVNEGRIEVKSQKSTFHWGTVCDDHFDLRDANVACRTLGLGTASRVFTNAKFGQGIRSIHMDNVACRGWESSFLGCSHRKNSDCTHYEDVSIRCNAPQYYTKKVRLARGQNRQEGYVEVQDSKGRWGAVCGDEWGLEEAIVVCRQLNLGYGQNTTGDFFGHTTTKIAHESFMCKISDPTLGHCTTVNLKNKKNKKKAICESQVRAGVICLKVVPDLVINVKELEKNVRIDALPLLYLQCASEENCLAKSADQYQDNKSGHYRRLLRFTTRVENRGLAAFRPNTPKNAWQWHECHKHYHSMEVFSTYDLLTMNSRKVGAGHKASFCLEDTVCDKGVHKKFNCTNRAPQGISPNCYDVYKWNIDCQWIDVTDFRYGNFYLRVTVNPDRKVAESDYSNNIARCWLYDYGYEVYASRCHLEDCESGFDTYGGTGRGECCVFPFKYHGKWHHNCLEMQTSKSLWCATTTDFDKDRKWGYCY